MIKRNRTAGPRNHSKKNFNGPSSHNTIEVNGNDEEGSEQFFNVRNPRYNNGPTFQMQSYRNKLKETIKKLQSPAKNQRSLMYKTLMPDYCQSKLNYVHKDSRLEIQPVRTEAIDIKQYRTNKGRSDAKELINQIYDTRLFQLLNESAKGLTGARGRRMAENRAVEKQKIIAKALEGFIQEKVLTPETKYNEQGRADPTAEI